MRKLLAIFFGMAMVMGFMASPAAAQSVVGFDWDGDNAVDATGCLDPVCCVGNPQTVGVYYTGGDAALFGVTVDVCVNTAELVIVGGVAGITNYDTANGGTWDPAFSSKTDLGGGCYQIAVGDLACQAGPDIKVADIVVECTGTVATPSTITSTPVAYIEGAACPGAPVAGAAGQIDVTICLCPCFTDSDADGILNDGNYSCTQDDNPCTGGQTANCDDNCLYTPNPDQSDADSDSVGDLCDNCPFENNTTQTDTDSDTVGDACDNCPDDVNSYQEDTDSDGTGNVCDVCTDTDMDGYGNPGFPPNTCEQDNCPSTPNGSGAGTCVQTSGFIVYATNSALLDSCTDNGTCGAGETCQMEQGDINLNGIGDACECYADCDNNTKVDIFDLLIMKNEYNRTDCAVIPCDADLNDDGKADIFDLLIMKNQYNRTGCPVQ